jgi:hypothetical protein
MLRRVILAVVVGVVTALVVGLVGVLLLETDVRVLVSLGSFLKAWATVLGFLAGVWYYITGQSPTL